MVQQPKAIRYSTMQESGKILLPAIYDAAVAKQHRFIPGSHIPILPSDQILKEKPDYVLVLPWNIAPEVRQQNAELEAKGTQFLKAIPVLEALK
jgi:hypothetical protein